MGVRVVFPDMGKDPSIQLIEKTITENGTYDAITDGANGYSKVNVNVEGGGGGGSDFSTAEVTIKATPTAVNNGEIYGVVYIDEESNITVAGAITYDDALNDDITHNIILYRGKYVIRGIGIDSVQGSATMVQDEDSFIITITGDCTITIS